MRRILIENARRKQTRKRGGGFVRSSLDPAEIPAPADPQFQLDLDAALSRLAAQDPAKAELVNLRYFAGLTRDEVAAVLGISPATADRWWAYAKSWLRLDIDRFRAAEEKS